MIFACVDEVRGNNEGGIPGRRNDLHENIRMGNRNSEFCCGWTLSTVPALYSKCLVWLVACVGEAYILRKIPQKHMF